MSDVAMGGVVGRERVREAARITGERERPGSPGVPSGGRRSIAGDGVSPGNQPSASPPRAQAAAGPAGTPDGLKARLQSGIAGILVGGSLGICIGLLLHLISPVAPEQFYEMLLVEGTLGAGVLGLAGLMGGDGRQPE